MSSNTVPVDLLKRMMEIELDKDIMSCEYCLHHSGRMDEFRRNCRLLSCMCINERLPFELVNSKELILDLISRFRNQAFTQRAKEMISDDKYRPVFFMNDRHKTEFYHTMSRFHHFNRRQTASVYLLTASVSLWVRVGKYADDNGIEFDRIILSNCSVYEYTLFKAAKNLYHGKSISFGDLTDPDVVPQQLFAVICMAYSIAFHGADVLRYVKE